MEWIPQYDEDEDFLELVEIIMEVLHQSRTID
jgi:hypothetical protein